MSTVLITLKNQKDSSELSYTTEPILNLALVNMKTIIVGLGVGEFMHWSGDNSPWDRYHQGQYFVQGIPNYLIRRAHKAVVYHLIFNFPKYRST